MKTIKLFFVLIFSTIALNSYSVNISNKNFEPKTDSTITVNQTGFNKIIENIKIIFNKKITKKKLIVFSICLLLSSIICPFVIIALGFGASFPLFWLFLLGSSCLFSIIGGIILSVLNIQKDNSIGVSILNTFSIIFGAISSIIWLFLAFLVWFFQEDL